jgi:uncharacterized protein involved in exopolysaccharide biosynthesis
MANEPTDPRSDNYTTQTNAMMAERYQLPDDEISLFDLWLVLVRRRWLMALIFVVIAGLGLAYALTRPDVYEYTTTLSIGQIFKSGDEDSGPVLAPVQSPSGVVAEINSVHAPAAVRAVVGDPRQATYLPEINVNSPEGSELVLLSGETTTDNATKLGETMRTIAERVESAHADRIQTARQSLQQEIEAAKNELERLQARKEALQGRFEDLDAREKSLQQRREELQSELERLVDQRNNAADDVSTRSLMTLNSRIASLRDDVTGVNDELTQRIPTERREARLELATVRSEMDAKRKTVSRAERRLSQVQPTRLASEPEQSLKPTGTSGKLILALAMVLGAMMAVFGAFVWEFVTRANAYAREQQAP